MGFIGFYRQRDPEMLERVQERILSTLNLGWDDLSEADVLGDYFPTEFKGLVGPEQEYYVPYEDVSRLKRSSTWITTDLGPSEKDIQVTADAGRHQLEINFPPIESFAAYAALLKQVDAAMDSEMHCVGEVPGDATFDDWIDDSRYTALQRAFAKEEAQAGADIDHTAVANIARAYALHFHFDYNPFESKDGLALLNTWNNIAPLLEQAFSAVVGVLAYRNRRYWSGWASPQRLPAYRWFDTPGALKDTVMSIPQLLEVEDEGGWRPYLKQPDTWNPAHAGTIYYLARPTGKYRVELRVFASMVPEMCVFALRVAMYYGVKVLRGEEKDIPHLTEDEWYQFF